MGKVASAARLAQDDGLREPTVAVVIRCGNAQDASMRFVRGSALRWGMSLALLLPVIALYACGISAEGDSPVSIQYDQPSYMALRAEVLRRRFSISSTAIRSAPILHTPAIYFQIHLLVLGFFRAITGCDPRPALCDLRI